MDKSLQRCIDLVSDLTQVTQRQAEQVVRTLVRRGEAEASRGERAIEGLRSCVATNRKAASTALRRELEAAIGRLGVARRSEIDRLQARIASLEDELRAQGRTGYPLADQD